MGTDAQVVVIGGTHDDVDAARACVDELERRWSRFLPESELCRVNGGAGRPVDVSPETCELVATAIDAWRATRGRFDPTVLDALEAAGYDRPFASGLDGSTPTGPARAAPGCGAIRVDARAGTITLPAGVRLDLGGIAKGHAADLVVGELCTRGVAGALVNLGGDLRVAGTGPSGDGWPVGIEHVPGTAVVVSHGGIATSATTRRRWTRAGTALHHVIDPATGRPARATADAITVFAATAAMAEVTATAALLAGPDAIDVVRAAGASGLVAMSDGRLVTTDDLATLASPVAAPAPAAAG
jgi:thiamine biosynthesis lipoprotein